jgi:predicted DNA-binding WGR domain protein
MEMTATLDRVADDVKAPAAAPPANDRLPFQRKINLLSDRGLWPQMESLAKRHGWHSPEMRAFIDAHLPKAPCPICGTPFYVYSRRVKYCSDKCRRAAAAGNERRERAPAALAAPTPLAPRRPKPAGSSDDLCVRLERRGESAADRRFYMLMVVQDLFGSVALVRRWGRDEHEHSQQVVTNFATLDQALEQLERHKEVCLKRGYRLIAVERGRVSRQGLE